MTDGIDCPGEDVLKINNVSSAGACCDLCLAHPECTTAVLAVGATAPAPGGQCMMKSSCDAPTTMPDRTVIHTDREPIRPAGDNPWSCAAQRAMIGGYSNLERSTDVFMNNQAKIVTLLDAASADPRFNVSYTAGVAVQSTDTAGVQAAVEAAKAADVAVVVVGDTAEGVGYDGGASCGEGADRPSLDLAGVQLDLVSAVIASGTPVIVVLIHGRPVTFGEDYGGAVTSKFGSVPLTSRMAGLVAAWRPGVEGGTALWSLLTGAESFSGRLAQSWPRSVGAVHFGGMSPWYQKACSEECPGFTMDLVTAGGSLDPTAPAFPFGYGLDVSPQRRCLGRGVRRH